ncbi:MAG: penicillin-binding protein [Candidatus Nomurabacteria bacterium]|jgi:penicillin-binding protein 1A|nr:penicillin-binding protein [Candidatus Nomurabacteria bacterium]
MKVKKHSFREKIGEFFKKITPSNKEASKKSRKNKGLRPYSNLSYRRAAKKDLEARRRAEDEAKLPKNPFLRFFARLHPKRVLRFWFSKRGLFLSLKIILVIFLIGVAGVGGLFLYFRKDLDAIRPGELAKRVQTTVNRYEDRNGVLLWEDKSDGDYKIVVESDEISPYMRLATVAIEDKDFYSHPGVSIPAIIRSVLNNLQGGSTQGGSTLTQQLIKQVYFSDIAEDRSMGGIPRKIKEIILAIEVERMYDKKQLITLYLNESPYGGRRNGVESGARTYFRNAEGLSKSAKDLTLAEAALLAAIPNNPSRYDPYNTEMNDELIERQHKTLDAMLEVCSNEKFKEAAAKHETVDICEGVNKETIEAAKQFAILDTVQPEESQYKDIKAPHFVLEVKKQLEEEFGVKTVRTGGLTIKTTLDYRAQVAAEEAMVAGNQELKKTSADNMAIVSADVETSQIIAMVGSTDWNTAGYGQLNATTQLLEPGSTIKPIMDYAPLFMQRAGVNYAPGSILRDENIDAIYCAGDYSGECHLPNSTGLTYGDITIRQALGNSFNRPAVKAMYITGIEKSLEIGRKLGDVSYCAGENDFAGLSSAIGGGCSVRMVEHVNAYATLARGGTFKPYSYILEVKNSSNEIIKQWQDPAGERVVDPQVAYMLSDILHDPYARNTTYSGSHSSYGFVVKDVWTSSKTGTTDNGKGKSKDNWFMSYSSSVVTATWCGNHDGSAMVKTGCATAVRRLANNYMEKVHADIYIPEGRYTKNAPIAQPQGIQKLTINGKTDIYPSWFNEKNSGVEKVEISFSAATHKKATECTPTSLTITFEVSKMVDPMTGHEIYFGVPDGYDPTTEDDTPCNNENSSSIVPTPTTPTNPTTPTDPLSPVPVQ